MNKGHHWSLHYVVYRRDFISNYYLNEFGLKRSKGQKIYWFFNFIKFII